MIPIHQTKFGIGGNCFSACIASILEVGIEDVPLFVRKGRWYGQYRSWLRTHGLDFLAVIGWSKSDIKYIPSVYSIVSGMGARGLLHAVVYFDSEMVHDPHPEGGGVKDIIDWIYIVPKRPRLCRKEKP